jgi:hypothetical protein
VRRVILARRGFEKPRWLPQFLLLSVSQTYSVFTESVANCHMTQIKNDVE